MKALTIKELRHMRENQDTLSLRSFWKNRKHQKMLEARAEREGYKHYIACHTCNWIEHKLNEAGYKAPDGP